LNRKLLDMIKIDLLVYNPRLMTIIENLTKVFASKKLGNYIPLELFQETF